MRIETKVIPARKEAIDGAARILAEGGLVAFPTDTVYGVGAHAFQPEAVERIYTAKIRPRDKAIPILLGWVDDLALVAEGITETAWLLAERFWPGGLTLVLPRKANVPDVISAGGPTVAVRVPDHPVFLALIAALRAPLAATSANLSGRPSPVTAQEVEAELGGRIELILDGGRCPGGIPSTVLDLTTEPPAILRAGAIAVEEIEAALAELRDGRRSPDRAPSASVRRPLAIKKEVYPRSERIARSATAPNRPCQASDLAIRREQQGKR